MKKFAMLSCLVLFLAPAARAQEPLCIVDGVVTPPATCGLKQGVRGGLINPEDIESIEILKGKAAAELYGNSAENGVILITLKQRRSPAQSAEDPFARYFYPPELIMAHQQAINLTDAQRSAIQVAMRDAQLKFPENQFKMSAEVEKLQRLLQGTSVDEAKVLEAIDRVLSLEREVKHTQVALMVRIKNQLTEQQQAALGKLRVSADVAEKLKQLQSDQQKPPAKDWKKP